MCRSVVVVVVVVVRRRVWSRRCVLTLASRMTLVRTDCDMLVGLAVGRGVWVGVATVVLCCACVVRWCLYGLRWYAYGGVVWWP